MMHYHKKRNAKGANPLSCLKKKRKLNESGDAEVTNKKTRRGKKKSKTD